MTVPLKLISLLNMATTKFPFRRKLDWLSDNAEMTFEENDTFHHKRQKKESFALAIWSLGNARDGICHFQPTFKVNSLADSCQPIVLPSEEVPYVETAVTLNCIYVESDSGTVLGDWHWSGNKGSSLIANTHKYLNNHLWITVCEYMPKQCI